MPSLNHYRFHSEWVVPGPREKVFAALRDVQRYSRWWPEVRSVIPVDQNRAIFLVMGILPYSLEFLMESEVDDPQAGVLQAKLEGDLNGFSRFEIVDEGEECRLLYDQEVEVDKKLLQVLAPVARPFFKLNHGLMMTRGSKGLRRYLASIDGTEGPESPGGAAPGAS